MAGLPGLVRISNQEDGGHPMNDQPDLTASGTLPATGPDLPSSSRFRKFGPGMLVAAAFIGPGTVTTASKAVAAFGFALCWAIVFSIFATIILQEMSARLGLVTRQGLGEAVRSSCRTNGMRLLAGLIVAVTIGVGNAAYQTGNIVGASIGLTLIAGGSIQTWSVIIGSVAFALLLSGRYRYIETALICLVLTMSATFLLTAIMVKPDMVALVKGSFAPGLPEGSLLTVIGLIGTTVVPYNLFLHASSVCRKWPNDVPTDVALRESRVDTTAAVVLGGLVTLAIVATAATAFSEGRTLTSAADMAKQLEPLLGGPAARIFFAGGLLAAGLTSAITAPLAAAFAISGAMGWSTELKSARFRSIWITVLCAGTCLAAAGLKSPQVTILIAQAANGLLLPLITIFLLIAVNRSEQMKDYRNGILANVLGGAVVLITLLLGATAIYKMCFV